MCYCVHTDHTMETAQSKWKSLKPIEEVRSKGLPGNHSRATGSEQALRLACYSEGEAAEGTK